MKSNKAPFAKKSFGQNFLADKNYIDRIIEALDPGNDETIIEIGAGRGALTERLLAAGAKVVAVELEREMIAVLKDRFGHLDKFTLVESDALKVDFQRLAAPPVKLVANLPYYISTAILQKLIEQRGVFSEMILMFQREVVERITAGVGEKERGFLTVLTEAFLTAERLFNVPPSAFRPPPKVWSAVVRLKPKSENEALDEKLFRELISAGFVQKRKTILNNLKNAALLKEKNLAAERLLNECQIESNRRAESLSLDEWLRLYRRLE